MQFNDEKWTHVVQFLSQVQTSSTLGINADRIRSYIDRNNKNELFIKINKTRSRKQEAPTSENVFDWLFSSHLPSAVQKQERFRGYYPHLLLPKYHHC